MTKFNTKRNFKGNTLGRIDYIVTNVVKFGKHASRGTLYWKFSKRALWMLSRGVTTK